MYQPDLPFLWKMDATLVYDQVFAKSIVATCLLASQEPIVNPGRTLGLARHGGSVPVSDCGMRSLRVAVMDIYGIKGLLNDLLTSCLEGAAPAPSPAPVSLVTSLFEIAVRVYQILPERE